MDTLDIRTVYWCRVFDRAIRKQDIAVVMHEIHQTCARIEKRLDVLILAVFTYDLASVAMLAMLVKLTFFA